MDDVFVEAMMVSLVCARTALANLLSASSPAGGWGWGCGCRRVSLPVSPDGAARRHGSSSMSSHQTEAPSPPSFHFHPELATDWKKKFLASFTVLENFVSEEEEAALIKEADPHLKRMVYEKDHWDEVTRATPVLILVSGLSALRRPVPRCSATTAGSNWRFPKFCSLFFPLSH